MTLNLPLLYVLWFEEYCQISPNKNRSPNLWHVTSILVCCIFWIHTSYLSLIFGFSSNLQVSAVALCPDNSQLVSGTRDGRVVLWCLESYSIIQELPAHKRQVNGVKFSCDAKRVVSCGSDFYMKVIDLQTGTILFSKGKLPMYFLFF